MHAPKHPPTDASNQPPNQPMFDPGTQEESPTYSSFQERVSCLAHRATKRLRTFRTTLQTCWQFHDKGIKSNETTEEIQGRLKSAALLNRTTRQSVTRLATSSRRSILWPGGGGGGDSEAAGENAPDATRQVKKGNIKRLIRRAPFLQTHTPSWPGTF